MASVAELKAELGILRQRWRLLPAQDEAEKMRRECEENVILVQMECEDFRKAFRQSFLLTKTEPVYKEVDEQQVIEKYVTVFNWEPVRDRYYSMIDKKEQERIAFYKKQIQDSYTNATAPKNEKAAV